MTSDFAAPITLHALFGNYPNTLPLKRGAVRSPLVKFDFADVKIASTAFKRVVRDLEFDFSELALVTYLQAKAHGIPLTLLPVVIVGGKAQHANLVYNAERGALAPGDVVGRRIGIRASSVTTVMWVRGILRNEYDVDIDRIHWVSFEEPHVAQFRDPPNVQRAPAGKKLLDMLIAGEVDAAVLSDYDLGDPRLRPLLPDPVTAAQAWTRKHHIQPINHMLVAKDSLIRAHPEAVREVFRLIVESKKAAGLQSAHGADPLAIGVDAMRGSLALAIEYCVQQKLIPRRFEVDELFDDLTRMLGPLPDQ